MKVAIFLLLFSLLTTKGSKADDTGDADINKYELQKLSIVGLETKQSSTYEEGVIDYSSQNAADGDTENGIAITDLEGNPAWSVYLQGEHCIGKVILYNRADCCSDRLKMAMVRAGVSNIPNRNERCGIQVAEHVAQERGGVIDVYCNPPLLAKMVSVVLPLKQHLQLMEVMVEEYPLQRCHGPQRRVSILQETKEQSSTFDKMHPARVAGDGYILTLHKQGFAFTGYDSNPWWKVTLSREHCISKVTLYNRVDCCSDRLAGAVVRAGLSPDIHSNAQCGSPITAGQASHLGGILDVYCGPPLRALYVSVDIPDTEEHLQLREVEIEELKVNPCESDERDLSIIDRPTQQSSDFDERYSSDRAADGNRDPQWFKHYRCTHTKYEVDPWWVVNLQGEHCISRVVLLNRGDCCSERLENAVVRAGTSADIHDNPQCGDKVSSDMAAPTGGSIELVCDPPLVARYISVDIPSDRRSFLQLCEVTVKELITEDACREAPEPTEDVPVTEQNPKKVIQEPEPIEPVEEPNQKKVIQEPEPIEPVEEQNPKIVIKEPEPQEPARERFPKKVGGGVKIQEDAPSDKGP